MRLKRTCLASAMSRVIGLGLVGMQGVHAGDITVTTTSDVTVAGQTTLREAVTMANGLPGSTIDFDQNVFSSPQTITLLSGELFISASTTIDGPGADLLTVDGNGTSRVFAVTDFNTGNLLDVSISGIRMQNGVSASGQQNQRAGCLLSLENLTLNDAIITGCSATVDGGGLWSRFGTLSISNSTIHGNTASTRGGGLYSRDVAATITNTTISGNTVTLDGGGLFMNDGGSLTLSTVTGNTSTGNRSGGIDAASSTATVNNSVIEGNIGSSDVDNSGVTLNLYNSVVGVIDPTVLINGSNNSEGVSADLGPLQNNGGSTPTHELYLGSPAINRGDDACLGIMTDQRGEPRSDNNCDAGAFERQNVPELVVDTLIDETTTNGLCSLREAVTNADTDSMFYADCGAGTGLDIIGFDATLSGNTVTLASLLNPGSDIIFTGDTTGDGASDVTVAASGDRHLYNGGNNAITLYAMTLTGGSATTGGALLFTGGQLTLQSTILTGNTATLNGAAIFASGTATVSLMNSTLTGNSATNYGGALFAELNAQLQINDSTVSANTAAYGGALFSSSNPGTVLNRATITGNTADRGGAMENANGPLFLNDTTLSNNTAATSGGGIYASGGDLFIDGSTLHANTATNGGGISSSRNTFVDNSTFTANEATNTASPPGGLLIGATLTMNHSTVYGNTGSGLYVAAGNQSFISNSIIAGNTDGDCQIGTIDGGSNNVAILDSDGSCDILASSHLTVASPMIAALADNGGYTQTHALLEGSQAINSGDVMSCASSDQRGQPRDALCDRGAFELPGGPSIAVTTAGFNFMPDGLCSLPEAIDNANDDAQTFPDCAAGSGADTIAFLPTLAGSTIAVNSAMLVNSDITIDGLGASQLTLSGGNANQIFTDSSSAALTLSDMTLTEGYAALGGVINSSGDLTINDAVISANTATSAGGAITNSSGSLTLNRVTLENNQAGTTGGGAIYHAASGTMMTVNQSTLSNNRSLTDGGAVLSSGQSAVISQSTLSGNSATSYGGGAHVRVQQLSFTDSTVSTNEAAYGGGVGGNTNATLSLQNSTLFGNTAGTGGAAVYLSSGSLDMTNSILASSAAVADCIVPTIGSNISNLVEDGTCNMNAVGFLTGDPMLGPLSDNGGNTLSHLPTAMSQVVEAGDNASCTASDQRGEVRPQDSDDNGIADCEIGSIERRIPLIFFDGFES